MFPKFKNLFNDGVVQEIVTSSILLILSGAINYLKIKKRFAIATVVDTWGSSPRPIGSQMLVTDSSEIIGSVSGGCIESAVIEESFQIMKGASPKKLNFNVSNERAWEVGLTCGGKVSVYIETDEIETKIYESMMHAIQSKHVKYFRTITLNIFVLKTPRMARVGAYSAFSISIMNWG